MPQMKPIDFLKTLERMYLDSRILYEKGEYYNCCYLCGYVLECSLKYILQSHACKQDGTPYTVNDLKDFRHNTSKLNQQLNDWLSVTTGVSPMYRLDCNKECPYIFVGKDGYPHWDPAYRYGDHTKWYEKEYCKKYIDESEYLFRFVANIVVGGAVI